MSEVFARRFRVQGEECGRLGSPMYAELMERAARDAEQGGVFCEVLAGHEDDPGPNAIALRLFGPIHRFALAGDAPEVAQHYPSAGGDGDVDAAWDAVRGFVAGNVDRLRPYLDQPPQTNEVGRSAALATGFLSAAARWPGRPLRLLEVGASGGLNLRWDQYHYDVDVDHDRAPGWGDEHSPLRFPRDWFETPWPSSWPARSAVNVVERRGCDIAPVDAASDDGRLTLLSYVWPDQHERFARLRAALDIAHRVPAPLDRADAAAWVADRLTEREGEREGRGVLTIVFHSIFIQYLTDDSREQLRSAITEAGERATDDAPLAWVRLEPVRHSRGAEVRLTAWPGGSEQAVASAGFHGPPVRVV